MLPKFTGLPQPIFFVISGAALIPLWWRHMSKKKTQSPHPKMPILRGLCYLIFVLAACSVVMVFSQERSFGLLTSVGGKTAGLIGVYLTLIYCARSYSANQISKALLIYAVVEVILLSVTREEWNPNTVSVRGATSGLIGYYLLKRKPMQLVALGIGLAIAFIFRSRTVLVGTTLAILLMWIVNRTARNKELVFIGF